MATLEQQWDKVRAQRSSQVAAIQRPAQLLLAVDETLGPNQREPEAYWVALLSTLDQLAQDPACAQPGDKRQLLEATLYLVGLVAPHLDPPALRAKVATLATVQPLLASFAAHAPALKSLVALAQALLVAAPAHALQHDLDGCRSVYATILSLCADARPKVRRRAQEAVHAVLGSPPPPASVHPYADETAQWVCAKLDDALRAAKRGAKAAQGAKGDDHGAEESRAIALLTFIRNLGTSWPISATPTLLPLLLSTLTLSSQHLTLAALTLLSHLFSAAHAAEHLSDDHVRDTLEALVNARPRVAEGTEQGEKLLAGWIEGVGEGMVAFARTDAAAALERLSTLFPSTLPLLASATTPALRTAVETACTLMIRHCVPDSEILASGPTVRGVIEQVEKALTSARYAAQAQPHVLALAKALFVRLRVRTAAGEPAAATLLSKTLVLVGKQREDSRFEWKKEADAVLDSAIKVLGPATVLRWLPLGLSADNANPAKARAWLLPLLKPAITNTRLAHFRETFVPLSAGFFNKAEEAKAAGRAMEGKVWETLVGQVWALLPGYCEYPTDLVTAFDADFVALLANVVYTQPALRPSIFKALSTLLATTVTLANSTSPPNLLREQFGLTPADGQESLAHLRALAQTVLSVAFNVYGKMQRGEGGYVLETVGAWLAVLPADELAATYERVSGLAAQALAAAANTPQQHGGGKSGDDTTLPAQHALLDILVTLVPHARGATARALFDFALADRVIASGDAAVQKKGYRILARLCDEGARSEVLTGREGAVIDQIVEGAAKVANGAKRDRVSLLAALVPLIPAEQLHIVPSLIPEAVLATKESNGLTREAAYALLVSMGEKMAAGGRIKRHLIKGMEDSMEDEVDASAEEFVTMLSAGLAASNPHMIAASIGALGRLVWEFHSSLDESYLRELTDTIVVFLTSANREIVKAGLGFVKIAVVTLAPAVVTPSLPELVPALVNWSHEHSNHFKVKVRHLLERMIRKYGYDDVERYVPEDDKKLVSNIRKRHARSKKKKAAAAASMDVDGALGDSDDEAQAHKPQAAQRSAYDEVLYGSESDVSGSDGEDASAGAGPAEQGKTAPSGVKNRKAVARKARKGREEGGAYIQEGEDEVLDLLDDRMMSRITAAKPVARSAARKPLDAHFKTDDAGRFRFEEPGADNNAGAASAAAGASSRAGGSGGAGMGDYVEAMHGEDGHTRDARGRVKFNKTQGKRARGSDDFADADDNDAERDVPVTAGLKELEVGGRKKKQKKEVQRVGSEFKAKRAGGDVKKDGMQPYAFVPLSQVAGKKSNQRGPKLGITGLKRAGGGGGKK